MAFEVRQTPKGPIAIPSDAEELGRFLALQRAINGALQFWGKPGLKPIAEDGRPGNNTLNTYNQVSEEKIGSVFDLADNAEDFGKRLAAQYEIPYNPALPSRPPATSKPNAKLPPFSPGGKKPKTLWWVLGFAALGGVIAIGVVAGRKKKARRRRLPAAA